MTSTSRFPVARKAERLAEIPAILAEGLQRALARQSTQKSTEGGESSLPISPDQSGHQGQSQSGETA
jgi:hypothetical protein